MKTTTIVRAATRTILVGATTVALAVSGAGLASADDGTVSSTLRSDAASSSAPPSAARKAVTSVGVSNPVIRSRSGAAVTIALGGQPPANTDRILAEVRHGAKRLAVVAISATTGRGSFQYRLSYGRGARSVSRIYFYDGSRSLGSQAVNRTFYARSAVKGKLKLTSRGSAKRAKANVKVYSFTKGKWVSAKRVTLQVRSGGKWKKKKTIRLNSKGTGYHSFRSSSAKKYRLKVASTTKVAGGRTGAVRI